jgi:hypothetical protein
MGVLATALRDAGVDLTTFATSSHDHEVADVDLPMRWALAPWWQMGRGPSLARWLPDVDVVHVAGPAVPTTGTIPLLVSVDDLRPLRDDESGERRVRALQRAVRRGARIVTTSHAARHEVIENLGLDLESVIIAHPAVPHLAVAPHGTRLVVSITGTVDEFLRAAPGLETMARGLGIPIDVLASPSASSRLSERSGVRVLPRRDGAAALANAAAVLHLSDGARFPSFAIAAMAAGIPTAATATAANDELLGDAIPLVAIDDADGLVQAATKLVSDEAHRRLVSAAGHDRARDFTPLVAAARYATLYGDLVAGGARR